jgi:hypothetical protein
MSFPVRSTVIASILGGCGPLVKVSAHWPLVEAALDAAAIYSPLCAVGAIATISVETRRFSPTKERGGPTYLANVYENRRDLGNVNPGDGAKFQRRGFIPIIGRRDYEHFGMEIGKDLAGSPDLALDPAIAAAILAVYFKERDIRTFADRQNWEMVRRRVNAAMTGWLRFIDVVAKLVSALKNSPPSTAGTSQEAIEELNQ